MNREDLHGIQHWMAVCPWMTYPPQPLTGRDDPAVYCWVWAIRRAPGGWPFFLFCSRVLPRRGAAAPSRPPPSNVQRLCGSARFTAAGSDAARRGPLPGGPPRRPIHPRRCRFLPPSSTLLVRHRSLGPYRSVANVWHATWKPAGCVCEPESCRLVRSRALRLPPCHRRHSAVAAAVGL